MIEFIGKFHPLLVHLPIGFLVLLGVFEMLATRPRWQHLTDASRVVLALTFPVTLASIVCGWLLAASGEYEDSNLFWHRWLGTGLGLATLLLFVLHWTGLFRLYRWGLIGTLGLLAISSHLGGSLTHGSDFISWPSEKLSSNRPKFSGDLKTAPVYEVVIQPIFDKSCVGCHGPNKSKGGLRLDTVEHFAKGGETGSLIDPPGASQSLLGKRLALPLEDEDHMPPEAKPQLSTNQLTVINWWLDAGAPTDKTIQELSPTSEVFQMIESLTTARQ